MIGKRRHSRRGIHVYISATVVVALFFSGCQTAGIFRDTASVSRPEWEDLSTRELDRIQLKLVEGAKYVQESQRLIINGRRFNNDCTGTVLAIYWYAGIDLMEPLVKYQGNGVNRLYLFLKDSQALVETRNPVAGDIIFWDNTYDRNGDREANDYLTHTGMVVAVEEDGTIHYVHHNYRKGIVFARMNLYRPDVYTEEVDGKPIIINSPMRMRGSPGYDKWLASELTRSFGRAWAVF